jgi:aspartyl protease family protein
MGLYDRDYVREKAQQPQKLERTRKLLERSYAKPKRRIRSGAWLVGAGWLVMLGLLTLLFQHVLDRWSNPNQNPVLTTTANGIQAALKRNRQGHYMVTGRINHQEVVFMLDTGATTVVVSETLLKAWALLAGRPTRARPQVV